LVPGAAVSATSFSEPNLEHVLICLDGSALAEQVLQPAQDLAELMEARCTLLRVIEQHSSEAERAEAEAYLREIARRALDRGLQVRAGVVAAAKPADAILKVVLEEKDTVIALATHGRGGFKCLVLGSVADRIVRTAGVPVLLCGPSER